MPLVLFKMCVICYYFCHKLKCNWPLFSLIHYSCYRLTTIGETLFAAIGKVQSDVCFCYTYVANLILIFLFLEKLTNILNEKVTVMMVAWEGGINTTWHRTDAYISHLSHIFFFLVFIMLPREATWCSDAPVWNWRTYALCNNRLLSEPYFILENFCICKLWKNFVFVKLCICSICELVPML